MTVPFNWTCPFCDRAITVTQQSYKEDDYLVTLDTITGWTYLRSVSIACPNPECKRLVLSLEAHAVDRNPQGGFGVGELLQKWQLIPSSFAKTFPSYIPEVLQDDYEEACQIRNLSPKASATLCRRCLQGMIRDFWSISKSRLKDEVDELRDKVDAGTWDAIDAVRQIGNIGAHMEQDVNLIVDVEPEEAQLLIDLIETLFASWYIDRHDRQERNAALKALADKKRAEKSIPSKTP